MACVRARYQIATDSFSDGARTRIQTKSELTELMLFKPAAPNSDFGGWTPNLHSQAPHSWWPQTPSAIAPKAAAPKRKPPRPSAASPAPKPSTEETNTVNSTHTKNINDAISLIETHPMMEKIKEANPIARGRVDRMTGKSGYKDIFNKEQYQKDLKSAGTSESAGNFFWQDLFWVPLAGVPVNRRSIDVLVNRNFKEPIVFPEKIIIALESADYAADSHMGSWRRTVARDSSDPARMKAWRYHLLTVTYSFVIAVGDEIHWK